ncbi:inner membrane protein [Scopulibacillus darangshiensis]|uniref:Inner membrane protein n=1 Tax=Scopulibacillus darangshiensis TaxID=442528 RepID=A0A4R2NSM3_9BACL|nr:metal-dependent hydrolase [Scopulibacillus darangshiensis]TCP24551.1 inner membrane protein [Scopulibacillus darangshiensis]
MDTGTHVVMGLGLAGLATLDPVVTQNPATTHAILFGTMAGSLIPDIDTVLKLKNNAIYIRHHRGVTHSIPATFLWPILIIALIMPFNHEANVVHVGLWTFIGVFLHVFVDIFNAYGTQAVRPISYRWVALGIINIFDPFIFVIHIIGFAVWFLFGHPGFTFTVIYIVLFIYYLWRIYHHHKVVKRVKAILPDTLDVFLSPTMHWSKYHLAVKAIDFYYVGEVLGGAISIIDTFERIPVPDTDVINLAKKDKNLKAFLSFSPIYRWQINPFEGGYEVRFTDLRYLSKSHYPFVAAVWLDEDNKEIISSFTGWVYSEEKLRKKLFPSKGRA